MLKSLFIQNYALIDSISIDFESGFSVITGETGAGKSIILGAIGLLLGQRADTKSIKNGENRCTIEATFDLSAYGMEQFFRDNDLDFDGTECIVRRELMASGKSRAFINDTPTQLPVLKELGEHLIDVHSQHQNLLLSKENFQINVLDIIAANRKKLDDYQNSFHEYKKACRQLNELINADKQSKDDLDYLTFQLNQIDEMKLEPGEQEELENESEVLTHSEDIKKAIYTAEGLMDDDESGIIGRLREAMNAISEIAPIFPAAEQIAERLQSCHIELRDIANELNSMADSVEFNPERLAEVNARLDSIYSIEKKHKAVDIDELLEIAEQFRAKLDLINGADEQIAKLTAQCDELKTQVCAKADTLSKSRKEAAAKVETQMKKLLVPLGIPNVQFAVSIATKEQPDEYGSDKVNFMFSANKNGKLQNVAEVASGGEIARVMLSLKALIAGAVKLPTIIFDEIDTGVSGSIAESMAKIMSDMGSNNRQVISITHLPQIAALGSTHYKVFKEDSTDTTTSRIVRLTDEQRVEEIAHMLSGSQLTEAAISNARELLKNK